VPNEKALSLLGVARRSGAVLVGQDQVFRSLDKRMFIITTDDCSRAVTRKIGHAVLSGGSVCVIIESVTREELGKSLGVGSAQIAALPIESGFVEKLAELLKSGGTLR
jgi:ribosomal protein L7Ae-like RNA K-turn-binding protein